MIQWISSAGGVRVERISVPHELVPCDLNRPHAGVGHTTEGSWESSLAVFREHYAPNFMVGKDGAGRVRIAQFVPVGYMSAALENHVGGGETNRWARAQIELVANSSLQPWTPGPEVLRAFAGLLRELRTVAGIPLERPFPDTLPAGVWATETNVRRQSGKWGREPGWFNHCEIPENDHWDMGSFQWHEAFAIAAPRRRLVGWTIEYTTKAGDRKTIRTTAPLAWQRAHPDAKTRGQLIIKRRFEVGA